MQVIEQTWSSKLNELIDTIKDGGASPDELKLMGVLSIMDETMRGFAQCPHHGPAAFQTYMEVETYLAMEDEGQ